MKMHSLRLWEFFSHNDDCVGRKVENEKKWGFCCKILEVILELLMYWQDQQKEATSLAKSLIALRACGTVA